jgi:hypothetical protein
MARKAKIDPVFLVGFLGGLELIACYNNNLETVQVILINALMPTHPTANGIFCRLGWGH